MAEMSQRIEQQYEGQEHQFLGYQHVLVYFVYSFSWDITKRPWHALQRDLLGRAGSLGRTVARSTKGWLARRLHERSLGVDELALGPNYQPNLVTKSLVIERSWRVSNNTALIIPVSPYQGARLRETRELAVDLGCTIRMFDNGAASCTFVVRLPRERASFENIHLVLRLARNVDFGQEEQTLHNHLTNTFIKLLDAGRRRQGYCLYPADRTQSSTYSQGYCSLHDLFRKLLTNPPPWAPEDAEQLLNDKAILDMDDACQDFQSPFVFTVAQVDRNSFLRLRKWPTPDAAKEVGSILCKLTLDSRFITSDYLHLSEDYIQQLLAFSKERGGLLNLCLDRRLFFAFSRRGAVAITPSLVDIPSCFVIPSLLNLCEIVRLRWHLGSLVSARLDKAISDIAGDPDMKPLQLMQDMYKWRIMVAACLRDPVPFLFDSGSVTEVAELADSLLGLDRLREDTARKFQFLDELVRDYFNIQRLRDAEQRGRGHVEC